LVSAARLSAFTFSVATMSKPYCLAMRRRSAAVCSSLAESLLQLRADAADGKLDFLHLERFGSADSIFELLLIAF
jgi:hypothetical protein